MRIVVKIGTSSVTDEQGSIKTDAIATLCEQVAQLRSDKHEVVVVTSGAVAGGVAALGMKHRPTDTLTLQALAAVGQSLLMNEYNKYLAKHHLIGAQVGNLRRGHAGHCRRRQGADLGRAQLGDVSGVHACDLPRRHRL